MFYPVDSLKRGGRFYLCWVADSWPLRFATITHRQLWSHDIRKICDDLLDVMTNESGRPAKRFSLRLSSQLLRGLVRLYQKKVNIFLGDLCMINAQVIKSSNKKWSIQEVTAVVRSVERPQLQLPLNPGEIDNEQQVEERIQNSGNVVSNIQDITLKEAAIPDFQLPPNDGFGEENPDQALQLLADRTVEMMLQQDTSNVQHSGLDLPLDITDKSHDKSRVERSRLDEDRRMERISEHDVTLFRKSTGEELLQVPEFEKDIPEIPEIPSELPAPIPDKQVEISENEEQSKTTTEQTKSTEEPPKAAEVEEANKDEQEKFVLEELDDNQPQAKKRRGPKKLIIDKKIKLEAKILRARIENIHVELRCEDSSDDIVDVTTPSEVLFQRPAHAGGRFRSNIASSVTLLYQRNLGVVHGLPLADREMEEALANKTSHKQVRSVLEKIDEVEEPPVLNIEQPQVQKDIPIEPEIPLLNITDAFGNVTAQPQDGIGDLLTQKIDTLTQQARKRSAVDQEVTASKRPCGVGYVSFKLSQQLAVEQLELAVEKENIEPPQEIPNVLQPPVEIENLSQNVEKERCVKSMLQEAGLADLQINVPEEVEQVIARETNVSQNATQRKRKSDSESSETPLGSLDRTKVSLGDSDKTTDSKRFIRDQWGTEGTMLKIVGNVKAGYRPLSVFNLIRKGPVISGYKSIIAARCFTSILKLKQHGFIRVTKDPDTLEIQDIELGPKFD